MGNRQISKYFSIVNIFHYTTDIITQVLLTIVTDSPAATKLAGAKNWRSDIRDGYNFPPRLLTEGCGTLIPIVPAVMTHFSLLKQIFTFTIDIDIV